MYNIKKGETMAEQTIRLHFENKRRNKRNKVLITIFYIMLFLSLGIVW